MANSEWKTLFAIRHSPLPIQDLWFEERTFLAGLATTYSPVS